MNTSQGALYFGAGIDRTQWNRDIEAMRRDIAGLSQTATNEARNMDSAFKNLSAGILGYFSIGAIRSFVMELVNVRGEFQKTEIAFSTMLGSAVKAAQLMDQMVVLAAKTPFSLQEVSSGAKQLLAFQIPADQVVDTLTRMGNIAAGLGVPLSRINLVYGQVKAKGKLMGDDLRQFTEAGIPMVAELAAKFGKTESEITAMVSAGKIGFKDVKEVLFNLTNEGGMFYNLMEKQSASVTGQIANLGDAWDQMLNKMGQSNEGLIYDSIAGLAALVENYQEVIKVLQVLIITYGAYRAALIATAALQGRLVAPAVIQGLKNLISLIRGATVAQTALNAASLANPYVLLATAIAGIVAILITYRKEIKDLMTDYKGLEQQIKYNEKVQEKYSNTFSKGISENREKIVSLIAVINSENSKLEDRKRAYEKLIKIDDSFRGALDAQYRATFKLGDAFDYVIMKMQKFALVQAEMAVKQEYLRQNAEDEFNLNIAQVKFDEASRAAKKYGDLLKQGKIDIKQYADYMRPFQEVAESLQKAQKAVKESRKDADYVNKAEKQKLETLRKQETILNAQIKGGKIQGKIISDARKAELSRDLKVIQEEIKLRLGETFEEIEKETDPKLGWAAKIKAQIDELESQLDSAPNEKAYRKIKAKIDQLNELLNPKKKSERQFAEILPLDSIKELQRRASLLQEAYDTAVNGVVKLRTLDKYGNDKDKKGNPFLTGEIITSEEAGKRIDQINEEIKKRQYKNFDEQLAETERQWKAKYQIAKYYGDAIANEQFPELKGSYYDDILQKFKVLENKREEGTTLTDAEINQWQKLKDILSSLNGTKDPLINFKENLDIDLRGLESASDKIDFLTKKLYNLTPEEISKGYKAEIFTQLDAVKSDMRQTYETFVKEKETFEQRKVDIDKKYDEIRKKIQQSNVSEEEKNRLTSEATKQQGKDISAVSLELFQKTDLWVQAFGDLEKVGPRALKKIKVEFRNFLNSEKANALKPEDLKTVQDVFTKVEDQIKTRNPYQAIGIAVENYRKKRQELNEVEKKSGKGSDEYKKKLDETNQAFVNIVEVTGAAAKATIEVVGTIGDAFGGLSDELKQTLAEVQQLLDGIINTVAGYFSGNYGQMISGIVQIVGAMVKLLSGDKGRERQIREWQRAVEDLKTSYDELTKSIERTSGEASLAMNRNLVENLEEQKRILTQMRDEEQKKKKVDKDKVTSYNSQINQINQQISDVMDNFKKQVTTTDFKDLSQKLADALIEAFGQGEDAAKSFDKVVDDIMKSAVANALRIKILEPAVKQMVDSLYSSMGFGNNSTGAQTANLQSQIDQYKKEIEEIEKKKAAYNGQGYSPGNTYVLNELNAQKQKLLDLIGNLEAQIKSLGVEGNFDGLTQEERDKIKAMGTTAMQQYMAALEQYKELFGDTAENAQGLKGGIKGITEKTAGALEGQFNAVRINIVEAVKMMRENQLVSKNQTLLLSQIEFNTRKLHNIDKNIKELNDKTKGKLAGVP